MIARKDQAFAEAYQLSLANLITTWKTKFDWHGGLLCQWLLGNKNTNYVGGSLSGEGIFSARTEYQSSDTLSEVRYARYRIIYSLMRFHEPSLKTCANQSVVTCDRTPP
jgi:hypothetical protein